MDAEPRSPLKIFRQALDLPEAERREFIDRACGADDGLRSEVRELLAEEDSRGVLDRAPSSWFLKPSQNEWIGPYRVIEPLGRGGMGVVFLAEQRDPITRQVALKRIHPDFRTEEVLARFSSERRVLAMMNHPNIAQVFDAGETADGNPYFAMEYVRGQPITEYADKQRLSLDERLTLFRQVLDAIQHAHQKGVIHRDLKPGNVLVGMIDGQPRVKVIDFGVAKALNRRVTEETLHTLAGHFVGTLEYMSPEQCGGENVDEDIRSDLYSAALLLYELLAGELPFDRERYQTSNLAEIHFLVCESMAPLASARATTLLKSRPQIANQRRLAPGELPKLLRGDLDAILQKGLDKRLAHRYQTAEAFRADVEAYLKNEPISARTATAATQVRLFVRRHRTEVALVIFVFSALIVGWLVTLEGWRRARTEGAKAVEEGRQTRLALSEARRQTSLAEAAQREARTEAERAKRSQIEAERSAQVAEKARRRAEENAKKLQAVKDFLENILASASPHILQGRDGTVLIEMIDRARQRLSEDLKSFPEGEASVRKTLADTLMTLGKLSEAKSELEVAESRLHALEHTNPKLEVEIALTRHDLHLQLGEFKSALELGEKTIARADQLDPDTPQRRLLRSRARSNFAWLLVQSNRSEEAEPIAAAACELIPLPEDDNQLDQRVSALNTHALVLKNLERYEEAEALYVEALATLRTLGEDHPNAAQIENNLGMLYLYMGEIDKSETQLTHSLERRLRILPKDHPNLAESYNNLGLIKQRRGKGDEAFDLFFKSRAILEKHVEPNHPYLASLTFNVAELLESRGDLDQASVEYRRAIEIDRQLYGDSHPNVARGLFQLARTLHRLEKFVVAESTARDAIRASQRAGAGASRIAEAKSLLAACLADQGRKAESKRELEEALELATRELGAEHWLTAKLAGYLESLKASLQTPSDSQ